MGVKDFANKTAETVKKGAKAVGNAAKYGVDMADKATRPLRAGAKRGIRGINLEDTIGIHRYKFMSKEDAIKYWKNRLKIAKRDKDYDVIKYCEAQIEKVKINADRKKDSIQNDPRVKKLNQKRDQIIKKKQQIINNTKISLAEKNRLLASLNEALKMINDELADLEADIIEEFGDRFSNAQDYYNNEDIKAHQIGKISWRKIKEQSKEKQEKENQENSNDSTSFSRNGHIPKGTTLGGNGGNDNDGKSPKDNMSKDKENGNKEKRKMTREERNKAIDQLADIDLDKLIIENCENEKDVETRKEIENRANEAIEKIRNAKIRKIWLEKYMAKLSDEKKNAQDAADHVEDKKKQTDLESELIKAATERDNKKKEMYKKDKELNADKNNEKLKKEYDKAKEEFIRAKEEVKAKAEEVAKMKKIKNKPKKIEEMLKAAQNDLDATTAYLNAGIANQDIMNLAKANAELKDYYEKLAKRLGVKKEKISNGDVKEPEVQESEVPDPEIEISKDELDMETIDESIKTAGIAKEDLENIKKLIETEKGVENTQKKAPKHKVEHD